MIARLAAILLLAVPLGYLLVPASRAQDQAAPRRSAFRAVDVFIDGGDRPLAAYQFELTAEGGGVALAGIEGGEHAAFRDPPYYDPKALSQDRIIIAAFHTGPDLPHGKTRVARLMVRTDAGANPTYAAKLHTAAAADGSPIPATVSVAEAVGGAAP